MSNDPKAAPSQEVVDQVYGDVASGNFAFTVKPAPSQESDFASEDVQHFAIQMEKKLCQLLDWEWRPSGMSIETLCIEIAKRMAAPSQEPVAWGHKGCAMVVNYPPAQGDAHNWIPYYTRPRSLEADAEHWLKQVDYWKNFAIGIAAQSNDVAAQIAELEKSNEIFEASNQYLGRRIARYKSQAELWACSTDEALKKIADLQAELNTLRSVSDPRDGIIERMAARLERLQAAARMALDALIACQPASVGPLSTKRYIEAITALRDALGEVK